MATASLAAQFSALDVEKLLQLVRVSELAERYEDMCWFVRQLVEKKTAAGTDLNVDERNLLSVAYKNVVGSKRAAWRSLDPSVDEDGTDPEMLAQYRAVVEKELEDKCLDILALLNDHLIPHVKGKKDETEVFYLKMAGDYYRYLCEFKATEENKGKAGEFYGRAWTVAVEFLAPVHPTRLGLALNYSVCHYEILKETDKACEMAKSAFDAAIDKLDDIEDNSYRDATLIMQLLRDNLTLWTSDQTDE
jgi:14-3-3 protein epsilon